MAIFSGVWLLALLLAMGNVGTLMAGFWNTHMQP